MRENTLGSSKPLHKSQKVYEDCRNLLITIVTLSVYACGQSEEGSTTGIESATEIVSEVDGATMVLIPAGTFQMGSTIGDSDEEPVHTVTLDAFYMDMYEVTNARYQKFVQSTGYPQPPLSHDPKFNAPDAPVVHVTLARCRCVRGVGKQTFTDRSRVGIRPHVEILLVNNTRTVI